LFAWTADDVKSIFEKAGFSVEAMRSDLVEKRRITESEIGRWFDAENSSYGTHLAKILGDETFSSIKQLLLDASKRQIFTWKTELFCFRFW
jgi:putative ATPase